MPAVEKLLDNLDVRTRQAAHDQFHNLASQLAELNGDAKGFTSEVIGQVLTETGRSRDDLNKAIRGVKKRRELRMVMEESEKSQSLCKLAQDELQGFLVRKAEVVRSLNDEEVEFRSRLDQATHACLVSKQAELTLQATARRSPAREHAIGLLRDRQQDLARLETELRKQRSWLSAAGGYAGVSDEYKQRIRDEARRKSEELEEKIRPVADEVELLSQQVAELEATDFSVL